MNDPVLLIACGGLIAVNSLICAALTLIDKRRARQNRWRIPESSLLIPALFGGAAVELFVMKCIHHKTRHKRFMIGLPLMILLHISAIILMILYL